LPQKARDVQKALKAKGFQESTKRDHIYYFLFHNGKKTNIFTKVSHSSSEIDDRNCSSMARQIRLSNPQFRDFVDCALTYDIYVKTLVQALELDPSE